MARDGFVQPVSRHSCWQQAQFTISLNFFIGNALTVFDAGLALKTHGSFVKGFTPFLAGVAGFFLSFRLSAPASLKAPFFSNSPAATATMPSMTPFTSFAFRPVVSATALYAALAVIPLAAPFIAFIGAMAAEMYRRNNQDDSELMLKDWAKV